MNLNKFITLKHQTHFDGFDVLLCAPKTTYTCFTTDIVSLLEPYFEKHNFYFDIKTFYLDGKQSSPVEMKHVYGDTWEDLIELNQQALWVAECEDKLHDEELYLVDIMIRHELV